MIHHYRAWACLLLLSTTAFGASTPTEQQIPATDTASVNIPEAQPLPITTTPRSAWFDLPTLLKSPHKSWSSLFLGAFLAGVLVSFTPCIYPMIPITATILQTHGDTSFIHQAASSITYVSGMATVYAALGYLSATTGTLFGSWMGNIWFVLFIMLFYLYCAGAMFGWYEMYTPQFLMPRTNTTTGKRSIFSAFAYGLIAGTFASPCLTPALSLLLGFVSRQGNPLLGLGTLFCFAFGMRLLLMLVGTSTRFLNMLPRAGEWMLEIKTIFGFLLVAMAFSYTEGLIDPIYTQLLYAALALVVTLYYLYAAYSHHCFARVRMDVADLAQQTAPRCTWTDWCAISVQVAVAAFALIQLYILMHSIVPAISAWLMQQGF